jgi:16S rRNA (guanine527-N7)-methyltransferase
MIATEDEARRFVASLCDGAALDRLERFVAALAEENNCQNLVARATLESVWQRHVADSAQLLGHVPRETGTWLDLGTGAGLPGLIIAAMRPDWRVVLVESRKRRVEWLERMRTELGLGRCEVVGKRLELVESFQTSVISARAFAPLPRLLDLSARFSTADTLWLLPKGRSAAQELQELPKRLRKLFHVEPSQTDPDAGIIVGRLVKEANA